MSEVVKSKSVFVMVEAQTTADLLATIHREIAQRLQLEDENRRLKAELDVKVRKYRIVQQAIRDASELALRRNTGLATGRSSMLKSGMSRRRWQWAIALLRYCQIISMFGKKFSFRWDEDDPDMLLILLRDGCERLEKAQNPLDSLRNSLPKSLRGRAK